MQLEWSPGIGDPHLMGWVIAVCYVACGFYCALVVQRGGRVFSEPVLRQKLLWIGLTMLMLFLGANKQLDLQSLVTEVVRVLAQRRGWYEERRSILKLFITGAAAAALLVGVMVLVSLRRVWRTHRLALAGVCVLGVFVVVRAAAFSRVDTMLDGRLTALRLHSVVELTGILLVWWNARRLARADHGEV